MQHQAVSLPQELLGHAETRNPCRTHDPALWQVGQRQVEDLVGALAVHRDTRNVERLFAEQRSRQGHPAVGDGPRRLV